MSDGELIISVKEARKILGSSAAKMTDDEVVQLICDLHVIAKYALEDAKEKLGSPKASNQPQG